MPVLNAFDYLILYFPWAMLALPPVVCLILAISGFLDENDADTK